MNPLVSILFGYAFVALAGASLALLVVSVEAAAVNQAFIDDEVDEHQLVIGRMNVLLTFFVLLRTALAAAGLLFLVELVFHWSACRPYSAVACFVVSLTTWASLAMLDHFLKLVSACSVCTKGDDHSHHDESGPPGFPQT